MKQRTATILAISLVIVVLGVAGCSKEYDFNRSAKNCKHYSDAINGDPEAQDRLAGCLFLGWNVVKNEEGSYYWFLIAAGNGNMGASNAIRMFTSSSSLSNEQMIKIQRRAAKDFRKYRFKRKRSSKETEE